jgi:HTH-type transcriptional regulator/antitoxin HipB
MSYALLMAARTGAEQYFGKQRNDPEYERAYQDAAATVRAIDELVRAIDAQREALGLSKAELARRAGLPAEAVRRLFTMRSPNPTATTLVALARALGLDLVAEPRAKPSRQARKVPTKKRTLTNA